jgi:hypothetical protein
VDARYLPDFDQFGGFKKCPGSGQRMPAGEMDDPVLIGVKSEQPILDLARRTADRPASSKIAFHFA